MEEEITNSMKILVIVLITIILTPILFLIGIVVVNAETSLQTELLNYNQEITATSGTDFNIFTSSNTLKNYGRGILQFNLVTYSYSSNTTHLNNSIREVTITSTNAIYTCNIGNAVNNYDDETNYDVNLYTVLCDVNLGSSGLQRIDVKMVYNLSNKYTLRSSQYMTFNGNIDLSILNSTNQTNNALSALNSTITTYLTSIYNAQINTNNYLSSIENIVNTDLTTIINLMSTYATNIISAIQNGNQAIINNQDENTQEQIDSQKVCEIIEKNKIKEDNQYLTSNGQKISNQSYGITDYLKVKGSKINVLEDLQQANAPSLCFYKADKTLINCITINTLQSNTEVIKPNNTYYIKLSINKAYNKPQIEICRTGNQAMMDADIDEENKEQPNKEEYDNYKDKEDTIMDLTENVDTSSLNIGMDTTTNNFIWNLMTRLINTHNLVYGLFIAILSIGVIKLVLAR